MKRLLTAAMSLVMVSGLAMAVNSENAVGYNTSPVTNGFNMISVNFGAVGDGTEATGIPLATVFPPTTPGLSGAVSGASGADEILVFDNTTKNYSFYFLYYTTKTTSLSTLNWTWRVSQTVPASVNLKNGDTVWFNKKGTAGVNFDIAGQVPNATSKNRVLTQGFNMVGNLYSADYDPNVLGTSWWSTSGASGAVSGASGADEILVFNNTTKNYSFYFLYYTTKTTSLSTLNWTWRVSQTVVAPSNFLKIGEGSWYNRKTAATVTLPVARPYTL